MQPTRKRQPLPYSAPFILIGAQLLRIQLSRVDRPAGQELVDLRATRPPLPTASQHRLRAPATTAAAHLIQRVHQPLRPSGTRPRQRLQRALALAALLAAAHRQHEHIVQRVLVARPRRLADGYGVDVQVGDVEARLGPEEQLLQPADGQTWEMPSKNYLSIQGR